MNDGRKWGLTLSQSPTTRIDQPVHIFYSYISVDAGCAAVGDNDRVFLVLIEIIPRSACEFGVQIATRQPRKSQVYFYNFFRIVTAGGSGRTGRDRCGGVTIDGSDLLLLGAADVIWIVRGGLQQPVVSKPRHPRCWFACWADKRVRARTIVF